MREWVLIKVGEVPPEVVAFLLREIPEILPIHVSCVLSAEIPSWAYNSHRDQYRASNVLAYVSKFAKDCKALGVMDIDLYEEGLNFVFGEAYCPGYAAIISLFRLRPQFYGEEPDEKLFLERALKEALHEMGHTYGLDHCPNRKCVMAFSNTIWDTDYKEARYCRSCWRELERRI